MAQSDLKWLAKRVWEMPSCLRTRFKNELTIEYDGLTLCYSTRSPVAKRWFYPRYITGNRLHEPPISALIRSELTPDSIFFDVGANLGFFTVLAANICDPSEGEVHTFELDPLLIPLIEESLLLNEPHGRVHLNCVACADETGRFLTFDAVQEANPSTNQVILEEGETVGTTAQIPTTSLDDYCRNTGSFPDLIKMDIEGGEALAVPGMLEIVSEVSPKIILEIHSENVRQLNGRPIELVKQLQEAGDYGEVLKVESYRNQVEPRHEVLTTLDENDFEGDHPVVGFFTPQNLHASRV